MENTANDMFADAHCSDRFIIVCGSKFSGCDELGAMLNRHPKIVCRDASFLFSAKPLDIDRLTTIYGLKADNVNMLMRRTHNRVEFIDAFSRMARAKHGKMTFADATPNNVYNLEWIVEHFPNAKIIHTVRSGVTEVPQLMRDTLGDIMLPLETCIDLWRDEVEDGLKLRGYSGYKEVNFHPLIINEEKTVRDVMWFCEIDFSADMLCDELYQWFPNIDKETQVDILWQRAGSTMQKLGYERKEG